MSSKDWKPWWEVAAKIPSADERYQFLRGVGGAKSSGPSNILLALLAGYVGGKIAQRKPGEK